MCDIGNYFLKLFLPFSEQPNITNEKAFMEGGREAKRKKVSNENEVMVTISSSEETTAKAFAAIEDVFKSFSTYSQAPIELKRLKSGVKVTQKITHLLGTGSKVPKK